MHHVNIRSNLFQNDFNGGANINHEQLQQQEKVRQQQQEQESQQKEKVVKEFSDNSN